MQCCVPSQPYCQCSRFVRSLEGLRLSQDDNFVERIRPATHSPASRVPSGPPTSCVVFFCRTASRTAASIFADSPKNPKCASIIALVRIAPKGFAKFFPAIGGAEPCTGSNIEVLPG